MYLFVANKGAHISIDIDGLDASLLFDQLYVGTLCSDNPANLLLFHLAKSTRPNLTEPARLRIRPTPPARIRPNPPASPNPTELGYGPPPESGRSRK